MALSPKHLCLLTLLFVISSLHVQARESVFFNKEVHYKPAKKTQPVPESAPSPKQDLDTINYTQENQNGYGLYGHGYQSPPTNTINNVEYTNAARNVPSKFSTEEYTMTNKRNYMNNEFTTTYPNNKYGNKLYGMSDTRFVENGRYFYDVNAENNYGNRYESGRSNQRYGSYGNTNGGYYGNNEKAYEYNISKEGYKGSQEIEEDYIP